MPDPQRFLRVGLENALDLAGQGGKDPGKLHFNAQGIVHHVKLPRRGLSESHDPQIRGVAVPIDLAVSEFIDVIPAQTLYSPGNPPFRSSAPRRCGKVMTIEFDMTILQCSSCKHF
jgi:hypothetical protein